MPQVVHCSACYHHPSSGRVPTVGEVYNRLLVCRGEGNSPTYGACPGDAADLPVSPAHPGAPSPSLPLEMTSESVQVKLELGHRALLRKRRGPDGFTHDWTCYVRGPEGCQIQHFVDKVVFHLHESFQKPKRTIKEPPYMVSESGYGGFTLPIEIYFKNKEEPRKIRFEYDLFLHLENCPPVNHIRCEKLTFQNPTEEFRKKLLKAGGVGLPGPNEMPMPPRDNQPNGAALTPENKAFTDLFGAPVKADSASKKHKSSSKEKVSGKPMSGSAMMMMSSGSSTPSSTHAGKDHKSTPTSSSKAAPKRPADSPPSGKSSKKKKKDKDRDKDRERKDGEKSKHKKHKKKDKKDNESRHASESVSESRPVQGLKSPKKPPPPPPVVKAKPPPPPAALRPFEEEVLSTGELSDDDPFNDAAETTFTPAALDQLSNASSHSFSSLKHSGASGGGNKPLNALMNLISDDSQSDDDDDILSPPVRQSPPSLIQQSQEHVTPSQNSQIPVLEKEKNEKTPPQPSKSSKKEKSSYKKSKHDKSKSKESAREKENRDRKEHESSEKENKVDNDNDDNDSGVEPGHPSMDIPSSKPDPPEKAPNGEYLTALLQLQRSLMTLTDRKLLQQVVQIIEGTGNFKISDATFDFDLCCLDAKTVRRLNDLISNGMCS